MRVGAILKRSGGGEEAQRDMVTYGGLTVDFTGRLVYIDGKRVDMTPKGIRPVFLSGEKQGHRPDQGKAD